MSTIFASHVCQFRQPFKEWIVGKKTCRKHSEDLFCDGTAAFLMWKNLDHGKLHVSMAERGFAAPEIVCQSCQSRVADSTNNHLADHFRKLT